MLPEKIQIILSAQAPIMKQFAFCLAFLISFLIASACINEESITIDGRKVTMNFYEAPGRADHKASAHQYEEKLKEKDSLWRTERRIED